MPLAVNDRSQRDEEGDRDEDIMVNGQLMFFANNGGRYRMIEIISSDGASHLKFDFKYKNEKISSLQSSVQN